MVDRSYAAGRRWARRGGAGRRGRGALARTLSALDRGPPPREDAARGVLTLRSAPAHPETVREMPQLHDDARATKQGEAGGAAPPTFPLRVAAVDVGSNAIRFIAAEFGTLSEYRVLAEERVPVRLGHDVFLTGKLAPDAVDAAVQAIAGFRASMEALGIEHYRAVATSATRESRNGADFVERVRDETGMELEAITGQ